MEENRNNDQNNQGQSTQINQDQKSSNGIGTAGFVLSIIALFVGWVPFIGWLVWLLGAVLSLIGVFKKPKGLSIAGLIISFIGVILLILIFAGIGLAAMSAQ